MFVSSLSLSNEAGDGGDGELSTWSMMYAPLTLILIVRGKSSISVADEDMRLRFAGGSESSDVVVLIAGGGDISLLFCADDDGGVGGEGPLLSGLGSAGVNRFNRKCASIREIRGSRNVQVSLFPLSLRVEMMIIWSRRDDWKL